jgi:hypothetical protein
VSFSNPIVGGQGALVRDAIKSRVYVPGVSGWSINRDGTAEFNDLVVNGGQILINNANGDTVASINELGNASFQDLSLVESPSIAGKDFQTEIIDPLPRGLKAYGSFSVLSFTGLTGEFGLIEVAHPDLPARTYNLYAQLNGIGQTATLNLGINIRYTYAAPGGTPAKPTLTSPLLFQNAREVTFLGTPSQTYSLNIDFELPQGAGAYRFLMSVSRINGTGSFNSGTSAASPTFLSIKDIGPVGLNTGVLNTGAGGGTAPVQTYTKNYAPLWSRAFQSNGTPGSYSNPNSIYQGNNQSESGVRHSMVGYDWATMQADLAGASIQYVAWTAYFAHWYPNSGGTCNIGYHNYAGGSAPGTYQTVGFIKASTGWPKPGLRTVDLTSTGLGTQLQVGAAKGITIGDGATTAQVYYGYANGAGMSNAPYLTITYTK